MAVEHLFHIKAIETSRMCRSSSYADVGVPLEGASSLYAYSPISPDSASRR